MVYKIIGANTYNQVASTLDSKALEEYNAYVDYLSYNNTDEYKIASNKDIIRGSSINKVTFCQRQIGRLHLKL